MNCVICVKNTQKFVLISKGNLFSRKILRFVLVYKNRNFVSKILKYNKKNHNICVRINAGKKTINNTKILNFKLS